MPATETGETLGRKTLRTQPNSPENLQQPLDSDHESLHEEYIILTLLMRFKKLLRRRKSYENASCRNLLHRIKIQFQADFFEIQQW